MGVDNCFTVAYVEMYHTVELANLANNFARLRKQNFATHTVHKKCTIQTKICCQNNRIYWTNGQ